MRANSREQYVFEQTHQTSDALELLENKVESEQEVAIGGRLLAIRDQGNMTFTDLHDETGRLQAIASAEITPEYEEFRQLNVGDWVGVKGKLGNSKRGEASIFVSDWALLAQTEIPFPNKRTGLQDPDTIARQRYLDLAVNPESLERFKARSRIISITRGELEDRGFMEVETPILQPLHGGAAAKPFETHHNALDMELFMRIAPELYLKRLVVGGLQKVFEIGKVFRNEGISTQHNPEFTMMEVYAAYWDYENQMQLTEQLVANIALDLHGSTTISYQDQEIDLSAPWPRVTMDSLVSRAVGEEVSVDTDISRLRQLCDQSQIPYENGSGTGKLLLELYEKLVEDDLWGPLFVVDYPQEVSPLARAHRSKPGYTERFEGIVTGMEICNGFTELNDAREQYKRFKDQESTKEHDDEAMPMDHDYVRALMYGLPPTAGLGIGIDRLAMLLTDSSSIRDVILFPTLRPDGYTTPY